MAETEVSQSPLPHFITFLNTKYKKLEKNVKSSKLKSHISTHIEPDLADSAVAAFVQLNTVIMPNSGLLLKMSTHILINHMSKKIPM